MIYTTKFLDPFTGQNVVRTSEPKRRGPSDEALRPGLSIDADGRMAFRHVIDLGPRSVGRMQKTNVETVPQNGERYPDNVVVPVGTRVQVFLDGHITNGRFGKVTDVNNFGGNYWMLVQIEDDPEGKGPRNYQSRCFAKA